eukprot:363869-Chlamydomonas_euryale.AAC.35
MAGNIQLHATRQRAHTCKLHTAASADRSMWKAVNMPSIVAVLCASHKTSVPLTSSTCTYRLAFSAPHSRQGQATGCLQHGHTASIVRLHRRAQTCTSLYQAYTTHVYKVSWLRHGREVGIRYIELRGQTAQVSAGRDGDDVALVDCERRLMGFMRCHLQSARFITISSVDSKTAFLTCNTIIACVHSAHPIGAAQKARPRTSWLMSCRIISSRPAVSTMVQQSLRSVDMAAWMLRKVCAWKSTLPHVRSRRHPTIPTRIIAARVSVSWHAGPIVPTTFVSASQRRQS